MGYLHRVRNHLQPVIIKFVAKLVIAVNATALTSYGKDFRTNCCQVKNPPGWLSEEMVKGTDARISSALNWSIRRFDLNFISDLKNFERSSHLNFKINAYFRPSDGSINIGPTVGKDDFDQTFGHELVHLIFAQKYRNAIPSWLEEGLANHIGSQRKVDYGWLRQQKLVGVTSLIHPNRDRWGAKYHYQASTAAVEMIAGRCNLNDLLMLSVGRKLENYLDTFCKIKDIDQAFHDWMKSHK